jgi:hypothetical protein
MKQYDTPRRGKQHSFLLRSAEFREILMPVKVRRVSPSFYCRGVRSPSAPPILDKTRVAVTAAWFAPLLPESKDRR